MALLANSSFVNGITGWRPVNYATTVKATVVSDGSAHAGGRLLRAGAGQSGGSVAYDASAARSIVVSGWDSNGRMVESAGTLLEPSVCATAWVRATPGSGQFTATLALWQLPQPNRNTSTCFTVGEQWTMIGASYDLVAGGSTIRVEFYLESPGHSLDIDSVVLV